MGRSSLVLTLSCLLVLDLDAVSVEQPLTLAREDGRLLEGRIDWTDKVLIAYGEGIPDKEFADPVQHRLMGFRAAKATAYRNLLELAGQVTIDAETRVVEVMMASDIIRTRVTNLVQRGRVRPRSQQEIDGFYRIALQLELGQSFADAVFADFMPLAAPVPTSDDTLGLVDHSLFLASPEPHTGLLIDARGLELQPCLAPRILSEDGGVVYSPAFVERGYATYRGLAGYEKDLEQARTNERLGGTQARPLIVKALGVTGQYQTDPVIDWEDGILVGLADTQHRFLSQCRVIFLLGPDPEPESAEIDSTLFDLDDYDTREAGYPDEGEEHELPDETRPDDWPE